MTNSDPENLNLRAYIALAGGAFDWRDDLARLLRSDVPLERLLRDRLADFVENRTDEGLSLDLIGQKKSRDRFVGVAIKHEWMEIGRSIQTLIDAGAPRGSAIELVSDHAAAGVKKCEKALQYYRRTAKWIDKVLQTEAGAAIGRDWLEKLHHSVHDDAQAQTMNARLLEELTYPIQVE